MTTKNINTITLTRPKCSLQVGKMHLNTNQTAKSSWIPKFSDTMQIVEVRQSGSTYPNQLAEQMKHIFSSYILIENVRPELFLRRDFIKKFVHNGLVHLSQVCDRDGSDYRICSINNVLQITLNEKQYRRFGLIGKKVFSNKARSTTKQYLITCDLKDERIIKSDKHQDRLVQTFRRLSALKQLYFRYVPSNSSPLSTTTNTQHSNLSNSEATSDSLEFFKYVIHEYAVDGFQPVPLTGCVEKSQKIHKKWLNCSQLHPDLGLSKTDGIADIVDWIGYQILGINCDREEIRHRYPMDQERLDVSCLQLSGMVDSKQVQEILSDIFKRSQDDDDGDVIMRSLCLYGTHPKNSNLLIMRNFSQAIIGGNTDVESQQQLLTVARMINYSR